MSPVIQEPPKTTAELNAQIKHNMEPDPSWEETGEFHRDSVGNRFPVYRETVQVYKKVPQRDADGGVLYHLRPDGSRFRPMMEEVFSHEETYEFINVPVGNGQCEKVRGFRATPQELEKKAIEQANSRVLGELRQLGPAALSKILEAVRGAVGLQPREPVAPAAPAGKPAAPAVTYPQPGPRQGTWVLSAEHAAAIERGEHQPFEGKKKEAEAAAEELAMATAGAGEP